MSPGVLANDVVTASFMTTNEVAELARTSPATVRYWRQSGYGPPGAKVGRRVLYERTAVEKWMKRIFAEQQAG